MNMPAAWMERHRRMARYNRMRIIKRDVEMAERCGEIEFRFYGREGDALVEGVSQFKYLGWTLDQT